MCGIVAIYSCQPVAPRMYDSLLHLQHRGQDAAGVVTYDTQFHLKKGVGLVREVFDQNNFGRLTGNWGIGHVRYPTMTATASSSVEDAQPFLVSSPYGMALAHNGNLVNYLELKEELAHKERFHCNSGSDGEVILNMIASSLSKSSPKKPLFENLCRAVENVLRKAQGGYSVVGMIAGKGMFAFRDPHGIRPLIYSGRTCEKGEKEYIFASESTMFYAMGFSYMCHIRPGELVFIDEKGKLHSRLIRERAFTPCVFEYVYFARADSMMNDVSVYRARLRMGQNLAEHWKKTYPKILPDVVIPVPFSSNTAALSMAHELGVRYSEGLYKNAFVGRTFIMPGQAMRVKSVRQKLSPQETEIRDKVVMILDDSIVRGTTSKEVVQMVRDAGAKKIYFVSACPPVVSPCFYGVDMPTKSELIASKKSVEEIRKFIGADLLLYQTIQDLEEAVTRRGQHGIDKPCMACLTGKYITGKITPAYLRKAEAARKKTVS